MQDGIEFGVQLAASAALVLATTIIHGIGLVAISRFLRLEDKFLDDLNFDWRAILRMSGMTTLLFFLHMTEIALFAWFYVSVDAIGSIEDALAYSASTYATLGQTLEYFPQNWQLMGSIEAVIGFLMIGWSTGFIFSKSNHLMP